jgi:chemotaxis signal transduction protein
MSQGSLAVQQDSQLISFADQQEFVTMEVGGQLFGVSVMGVQDVLRNQTIANVPL